MKRVFTLVHDEARRRASDSVSNAPNGWIVTVCEPTRNLEQNAMLWVLLSAFSEQLKWPVNGRMVTMTPEEWKDVLSAAYRNETARLAMGLDGGVVMLGMRTSQMSKSEFSGFLEFIQATAAARGVELGVEA